MGRAGAEGKPSEGNVMMFQMKAVGSASARANEGGGVRGPSERMKARTKNKGRAGHIAPAELKPARPERKRVSECESKEGGTTD